MELETPRAVGQLDGALRASHMTDSSAHRSSATVAASRVTDRHTVGFVAAPNLAVRMPAVPRTADIVVALDQHGPLGTVDRLLVALTETSTTSRLPPRCQT